MNVIVISPFCPKDRKSVEFSALATYTKKLLQLLPSENIYKVLSQNSINSYSYKNVEVLPTWSRNNVFFVFQIIKQAFSVKSKAVFLEHEVYAFGKNQYVFPYLTILLILLLKIIGKKVVVSVHGVVPLKMLNSNFIKDSGVVNLSFLIKLGMFVMYYFTCLFASQVLVHNKKLKEYLVKDYMVSSKKIHVIPHPLYNFSKPQKISKQFKKLTKGYKYIFLYFGFLSMYKSLNILIDGFKLAKLNKKPTCLLIAGGVPKRLRNEGKYLKYIKKYKDSTKNFDIFWDTRFIKDSELKTYFTKSSCLIIPYKYLVSASGPLTLAVNSALPVLASSAFKGIIAKDLIFGKTSTELARAVEKYVNDRAFRDKVTKSVIYQKQLWSDEHIKLSYQKLFDSL